MGIIIHDEIIVSGSEPSIGLAHRKAIDVGLRVTNMVAHRMNGESSFLIVSDGSKEGWAHSDEGERQREQWLAWFQERRRQNVRATSSEYFMCHYVHVRHGEVSDESGCCIVSSDA